MSTRILIAEDDSVIRTSLALLLEHAGYESVTAASYAEAVGRSDESFALYLFDIMLGDGSGLELCRYIRQRHESPIIFITALDDEQTAIAGLSAGADDYVTKPFRAGELLARIAANLRRRPVGEVIKSGAVKLYVKEERVTVSGEEIRLRRSELTLLKLFLESGGRLLKRERIVDSLWDVDGDFVEENTLSVLVSRLRKDLARFDDADYIETVRGVGYRWKEPCTAADERIRS